VSAPSRAGPCDPPAAGKPSIAANEQALRSDTRLEKPEAALEDDR